MKESVQATGTYDLVKFDHEQKILFIRIPWCIAKDVIKSTNEFTDFFAFVNLAYAYE